MTPSPQQASQQAPQPSLIDWGVSSFVPPGETECGDMHLVKVVHGGVLAAMVDGVGHGAEAAAAARVAVSTLESHAGEGIVSLLRLCHQNLKGTRGAVINVITFDGERDEMAWLGVGNIAGLLVRTRAEVAAGSHGGLAAGNRKAIALRGGVVGYKLPPLHHASMLSIRPGDTVVLATDGISPDFAEDAEIGTPPGSMADRLCAKYATRRDDAMVMVIRYLGWSK